ncbi:hypothetical protein [Microbacterium sulfonylureivorans]|uniref:hypothetical protein n=1 Tax=Microbacterium sulfonylureivorans TaxID=2486854 RepID=UPI000FDB0139|nr:hypothetical protein [Microbacterium sulfonylureivorans]
MSPKSIAARHRERIARSAPVPLEWVSATGPVAVISIIAVILAAVPLLTLDPQEHEGAAVLVAVGGVPMLASAAVIEVLRRRVTRSTRLRPGWA